MYVHGLPLVAHGALKIEMFFFFDFPIPGVILRLSRLDIVRRVPIALIPVVFLPGLETLAN